MPYGQGVPQQQQQRPPISVNASGVPIVSPGSFNEVEIRSKYPAVGPNPSQRVLGYLYAADALEGMYGY